MEEESKKMEQMRRHWTDEEDNLVRAIEYPPGVSLKPYEEVSQLTSRGLASVKSRWYTLAQAQALSMKRHEVRSVNTMELPKEYEITDRLDALGAALVMLNDKMDKLLTDSPPDPLARFRK